tara:strand:+ start:51403 stop:51624 length:222 start_codon:yes stop_codon:yes gene_type:complete
MSKKILQLDDSVVGHVAKILQVALVTGTDIIDHMRMIRLTEKDTKLFLEEDYQKTFDVSLDTMLKNAQERQGE